MSTAASATRPTRCSRSAWPRSKAAAAPSPPPAARRRCTWPSPRWPAPARTSSPAARCTAAATTCCTTRCARFGIETTFVKPGDIDGWRAAIRPNTRLLFGETLGNPGLDVLDIPTVSAIAHDAGLPLLVDSHLHHALADEALRPRRRPGLPLGHQVPVRPRHGDRRRAGRQRPLRLGRVGPLPRTDRALRRLPRHGVQRGEHASAPSCCARAARACATSAPA